MSIRAQAVAIEPLNPTIGAIIRGVELSSPLSSIAIADIRRALLRHQVVFFEDQRLTPVQQRAFAACFGELHIHPVYPQVDGVPEVFVLDNHAANPTDNNNWHTDVTFIETPPLGAVLYAEQLPPLGGDTIWSSMTAAYDALSEPMRLMLGGLNAEHDFTKSFPPHLSVSRNAGAERYERARDEHPPVVHPVIRTHPETGRPGLFVNDGFTTRILGLNPQESRALLDFLFKHIAQPEFLIRWQWKPGCVALWDNRCTQHYAVNDYLPNRRIMRRATILGDRPYFEQRPKSSTV